MLQTLRMATRRRLIVFNYHRICGDNNKIATDFDDDVFGPAAEQFEEQIVWLKNNADILDEKELLFVLEKRKKLAKPSAMITFDDGYIDNFTVAFPILKKHNIPAMFFIPTEHIMTRQLGWWDIIAYLIKKTHKSVIRYDEIDVRLSDLPAAIRFFLNKMKLEPFERTNKLLTRLSEACEVALPGRDIQNDELMTWDQIREISRAGMTIGSHTHSHTVLSTLSNMKQKNEMQKSKSILEGELGCEIHSISYPVGNYEHFSIETQLLAAESGYKIGFSFNTGINYDQEILPFDIKRVESQREIEIFTAMTLLPQVFV
jgi:peptidoglycan/xylan/chitin deacetylase (PgdA/CDA1 family)